MKYLLILLVLLPLSAKAEMVVLSNSCFDEPVRSPWKVAQMVAEAERAAIAYGLDPDKWVVLVGLESSWNPRNVHPRTKCAGLAQVCPKTIAHFCPGIDPEDEPANLWCGVKVFSDKLKRHRGDYFSAAIAYVAGDSVVYYAGKISRAGVEVATID